MGRQIPVHLRVLHKSGAAKPRGSQVATGLGITHRKMKMLKKEPLVPDGVTSKAFLCQEETQSSHSCTTSTHTHTLQDKI